MYNFIFNQSEYTCVYSEQRYMWQGFKQRKNNRIYRVKLKRVIITWG